MILGRSIPEPNSGCWLWHSSAGADRYGTVTVLGRTYRAHRLSFRAFKFEPGDLLVCHSCDTRACVNPDHLFLGSHYDNMRDMARKGRGRNKAIPEYRMVWNNRRLFSAVPFAGLTDDQVRAIRADPRPQREVAKAFCIAQSHVHAIKARKRYAQVPEIARRLNAEAEADPQASGRLV